MAAYSLYARERNLIAQFQRVSLQGAQHLARSLVSDIYLGDRVKLSRALEIARANPTIKHINLSDANGLSLLTIPEDEGVSKEQEDSFRRAMVSAGGTWIRAVRGGELDVGGPISTPGGERIGYLHIRFSFAHIQEILDDGAGDIYYAVTLLCGDDEARLEL